MKLLRNLGLVAGVALGASMAIGGTINYTCDPTVDATQAGTCAVLNGAIAGLYSSTFNNANASIYIKMGITGLGESTSGFLNVVPYTTYRNALFATASADVVDTAAKASLPVAEPAVFNSGGIEVTSALGAALGLTGLTGTTAAGASCSTPGVGGCYNGIITVTTLANLSAETGGTQTLYWDQTGGTQPANAYDFYSVVEHETDEVLGTSSCIDTGGGTLSDGCGGTTASAVDLFRYSGNGTRVVQSTTPGAYFSYNSGATNGFANGSKYNTLANGDDYADMVSNCVNVQDATACLGSRLDITTDGGGEINTLDAVGYNRTVTATTPEPATMALFGAGIAVLGFYRRRRSA